MKFFSFGKDKPLSEDKYDNKNVVVFIANGEYLGIYNDKVFKAPLTFDILEFANQIANGMRQSNVDYKPSDSSHQKVLELEVVQ